MGADVISSANKKHGVNSKSNSSNTRKGAATAHRAACCHVVAFVVALTLTLAALVAQVEALQDMQVAYTWSSVPFVFDNNQHRQRLEENGTYVPGYSIPFDVDKGPNGTMYVTLPWMLDGSPASLATIENVQQSDSPSLVPYPDWSWHDGSRGCNGLTSAFRMHADRCGRLWVIDSGVADMANSFRSQCPPQLVVFNTTTNELLVQHRFNQPQGTCFETLILNLVVEYIGDTCSNDAYAYLADTGGFALYVYSLSSNSSWRVSSNLFFPDVNQRRYSIVGTTFELMDGLLGLTLSPVFEKEPQDRLLFFHPTTSRQEGVVRTSILRNQSLFADGVNAAPDEFQFIQGLRSSQAAGEAMTKDGVLFYSPLRDNTIVCWNFRKPFRRPYQAVVDCDHQRLRFVTSMKVIASEDGSEEEELWAVANNAQHLFAGDFQPNATNAFNIVRGSVRDLLARTPCMPPFRPRPPSRFGGFC